MSTIKRHTIRPGRNRKTRRLRTVAHRAGLMQGRSSTESPTSEVVAQLGARRDRTVRSSRSTARSAAGRRDACADWRRRGQAFRGRLRGGRRTAAQVRRRSSGRWRSGCRGGDLLRLRDGDAVIGRRGEQPGSGRLSAAAVVNVPNEDGRELRAGRFAAAVKPQHRARRDTRSEGGSDQPCAQTGAAHSLGTSPSVLTARVGAGRRFTRRRALGRSSGGTQSRATASRICGSTLGNSMHPPPALMLPQPEHVTGGRRHRAGR